MFRTHYQHLQKKMLHFKANLNVMHYSDSDSSQIKYIANVF